MAQPKLGKPGPFPDSPLSVHPPQEMDEFADGTLPQSPMGSLPLMGSSPDSPVPETSGVAASSSLGMSLEELITPLHWRDTSGVASALGEATAEASGAVMESRPCLTLVSATGMDRICITPEATVVATPPSSKAVHGSPGSSNGDSAWFALLAQSPPKPAKKPRPAASPPKPKADPSPPREVAYEDMTQSQQERYLESLLE